MKSFGWDAWADKGERSEEDLLHYFLLADDVHEISYRDVPDEPLSDVAKANLKAYVNGKLSKGLDVCPALLAYK